MKRLLQQPVVPLCARTPDDLWRLALTELRHQMTKATFNTWLADSYVLADASTPIFWIVVVRNEYASEWLTYRLCPVVVSTVGGLLGNEVTICFIPRPMRKRCYEPFGRPPARISGPI
jgi:chromosomal replication initiation ATPase DnaA